MYGVCVYEGVCVCICACVCVCVWVSMTVRVCAGNFDLRTVFFVLSTKHYGSVYQNL